LRGKVIGLDTAPLIYFIEAHPDYLPLLRPLFEALDQRDIHIVTSCVTLTEVLVHPLRRQNTQLAAQYRSILLNVPNFSTVAVSVEVAERAAEIRATLGMRTPDAIQLATASSYRAAAFLTNDFRMPSLPDLPVMTLEQLKAGVPKA
jgi:predicted nucleic acid-binding protein